MVGLSVILICLRGLRGGDLTLLQVLPSTGNKFQWPVEQVQYFGWWLDAVRSVNVERRTILRKNKNLNIENLVEKEEKPERFKEEFTYSFL